MLQTASLPSLAAFSLMVAASASAQAAEALPYDCTRLGQAIGAPVTEMTAAPDEGWQHAPDEARLVCTWLTQPSAKALDGQTLAKEDWSDVGTLTAQVVVYDSPLTREDAAMMNAGHKIPEGLAHDLDGAWIMAFKEPKMTDQLGIMPPEVLYENMGVSIAYANAFVSPEHTGSSLTVGWSIEKALKVMSDIVAAL